ncbi:hypothetical protein MRX96_056411 [Rhipicephalus microplus]
MCHGCRCAEVVFGCALNNNLRSIHTCTNKSSNAEVPMDTSSSDDEAAGQASVSTDINGILRTDTLSSEDEQETSSDACSTAASRVTSAPVSPTTPELQATNDRPQHANPMVSHDTLLNDEELSMSDEDGSEQHDPGELPSEDDMSAQRPHSLRTVLSPTISRPFAPFVAVTSRVLCRAHLTRFIDVGRGGMSGGSGGGGEPPSLELLTLSALPEPPIAVNEIGPIPPPTNVLQPVAHVRAAVCRSGLEPEPEVCRHGGAQPADGGRRCGRRKGLPQHPRRSSNRHGSRRPCRRAGWYPRGRRLGRLGVTGDICEATVPARTTASPAGGDGGGGGPLVEEIPAKEPPRSSALPRKSALKKQQVNGAHATQQQLTAAQARLRPTRIHLSPSGAQSPLPPGLQLHEGSNKENHWPPPPPSAGGDNHWTRTRTVQSTGATTTATTSKVAWPPR